MTLPARSGIMREQSMYYNIRNSLGITALALIIAAAAGQSAYAQLPNSGAANALPSEITLNDTDDDSGLLVPPSLMMMLRQNFRRRSLTMKRLFL